MILYSEHDHPILKEITIDFLSSGNKREKYIAVELAKRLKLPEAIPLLVKLLPEAEMSIKELIFEAMKNIRDKRIVDEMIRCLGISEFRWQAAEVLGSFGENRAVHALIEADDDP